MDFSTIALFRCTEKQYADSFVTMGNMKFNTPKYWVELEQTEGKGRGDSLEGVYSVSHIYDINTIKESNAIRKNIHREVKGKAIYFRSNDIFHLPCFCFFGLHDFAFFFERTDKNGIKRYTSHITQEYFKDFSENTTKELAAQLLEGNKPALVLITNPVKLFERVKNYFVKLGVKEEEILIEPVKYHNKKEWYIADRGFPYELFLKDSSFAYQSEVRIIINTNNQSILKKLADSNNIVNIGSLEDIASVIDFYYENMYLRLKGNKLSYQLQEPQTIVMDFHSMSKEELLREIDAIVNDDMEVRDANVKEVLEMLLNILKTKHNVPDNELPKTHGLC